MPQKRTECYLDELFCSAIAQIVKARNINLSALARAVDIERGRLYRIIDGQPPTYAQAITIAKAVGLDLPGLPTTGAELAVLDAVRSKDANALHTALAAVGFEAALAPSQPAPPSAGLTVDGLTAVEQAARGLADTIARALPTKT